MGTSSDDADADASKPETALRKADLAAGRGLDLVLSILFSLIGLSMIMGFLYGAGITLDSGNRDFYAEIIKKSFIFFAGGIVLLRVLEALQASNR